MTGPSERLLGHLRRTLGRQALAGLPDGQLLREFVAGSGSAECAFEMLVRRHGPMVLRTCLAAARDSHDAEDAFQATFLILVRRAGSLTSSDSLGPWLFAVARRVGNRVRVDAARRKAHEQAAATLVAGPGVRDVETIAVVHDEVGRLPVALRSAVVLCDLEGLTYQEAAERLGWTPDTVRGRLARARQRLRQRLGRLGVGPNVAVAVVEVPRALVAATTRAAAVLSGQAPGTVPGPVLALVNGGLQSMVLLKFKSAVLTLMAAGLVAAGAVGLSDQGAPRGQRGGRGGGEVNVATTEAEPADRIIELALQAKRQAQDGKAVAAARTLSQVEQLARAWARRLQPEQDKQGADVQFKAMAERLNLEAPYTLEEFLRGYRQPDLESRLRDVEQKLDRLLLALEGAPAPRGGPRGARGGSDTSGAGRGVPRGRGGDTGGDTGGGRGARGAGPRRGGGGDGGGTGGTGSAGGTGGGTGGSGTGGGGGGPDSE
jgi:RNA polymerase sigma factor (sigma-70 family)